MYSRGFGSCAALGGASCGLASTGVPIMITVLAALVLVVSGLFLLRWGTVRRRHAGRS